MRGKRCHFEEFVVTGRRPGWVSDCVLTYCSVSSLAVRLKHYTAASSLPPTHTRQEAPETRNKAGFLLTVRRQAIGTDRGEVSTGGMQDQCEKVTSGKGAFQSVPEQHQGGSSQANVSVNPQYKSLTKKKTQCQCGKSPGRSSGLHVPELKVCRGTGSSSLR